MKRRSVISILSVALGAAAFALRLLQRKTGFEVDTGLPIPGNVPAILLPVLLAAAAVLLLSMVRPLAKGPVQAPFSQLFDLSDRRCLFAIVGGTCATVLAGILDLADAMGGPRTALSADGMEIVTVGSSLGRTGMVLGVLSLIAGACLFLGAVLCRKDPAAPPLVLLAVPVCLLVRLILIYRIYSRDPVLADYYLDLLALVLLILGTYRLSGFAVQAGSPRAFALYAELSAILALAALADGPSAAVLLAVGIALALAGFQLALRPDTAAADSSNSPPSAE